MLLLPPSLQLVALSSDPFLDHLPPQHAWTCNMTYKKAIIDVQITNQQLL
jgi:hypothetical protein